MSIRVKLFAIPSISRGTSREDSNTFTTPCRRFLLIFNLIFFLVFLPLSQCLASSHPYLPRHGIVFSNGDKYLAETDITLGGAGPSLIISRYYNSRSDLAGIFGYGWSGGVRDISSLRVSGDNLIRVMANGRTIFLNKISENTWTSANGRMVTATAIDTGYSLSEPDGTICLYDTDGNLTSKTRRNGYRIDFSYRNGQLTSVSDSFARTISLAYENDRVSSITTPAGSFTYSYDTNDNLVEVTRPDSSTIHYLYEDPNDVHNLTGITNAANVRIQTIGYDDQDRVISSSLGGDSQALTIEYPSALERRITDSQGVTTTYQLEVKNGAARIKSFTGPDCSATGDATGSSYSYNNRLQVVQKTDARGNITSYAYDARGNRTTKTEAVGTALERTTTYTYTANNQVESITRRSVVDASGHHVINNSYDTEGNLQGRTESGLDQGGPISRTFSYTYDSLGRISSIDGPRTDVNDVTTFTYYANESSQGADRGNLHTITNGLGHTITFSDYTPLGKPQTIVPARGAAITLTYDTMGRVLTRSRGTLTTSYGYDPGGKLITISLPEGRTITFTYTLFGEISSIQDSQGNRISYFYDSRGHKTREEIHDPGGELQYFVEYAYHPTGLPAAITRADGSSIQLRYDAVGNLVTRINAQGKPISFTYDALDRLSAMTEPGNAVTGYGYDSTNNPTSVTDADNRTTTSTYDDFGRLISTNSPDSGQTVFTYDPADNLLSRTDANGITISYSHDALNRLTGVVSPGQNILYHYDEDGFTGLLSSVQDATGTTTYSYDQYDRLTGETRTQNGHAISVGYGYDDNSRINLVRCPSGRTLNYVRDQSGRVSEVETTFRGVHTILAGSITRKPFGPLTGLSLGNGITVEYTSDQNYRLTGIKDSGGLLYDRTWSYFATGRVQAITDHIHPSFSQSFTYDDLGRLTGAQGGYGNYTWSYDLTGNRLNQTHNTDQTSYSLVPGSNRLAQSVSGQDVVQYSYDNAGDLISRNTTTFTYNDAHRLIAVTDNNTVVGEYGYDHRGLRSMRTVNGQTTWYIHDQSGHVLADMDESGRVLHEYAYLDGRPLARFDYTKVRLAPAGATAPPPTGSGSAASSSSGADPQVAILQQVYFLLMLHSTTSTFYYLNDHLGTPQLLLDRNGRVVWQGDYHPFGRVDMGITTRDSDFRFPGQRFDQETGLHYNAMRYYDPDLGRYITPDPIGLAGGINPYIYVQNDPVNAVDSWGLHRWPGAIEGTSVIPTGACHSGKPTNIYWNIEGGIVATGGISHEVCCDGDNKMLITIAEICTGVASGIEVSFTQDSTDIPKCSGRKVGDFSFGTKTGGSYFIGAEFDTSFDESGGSVSMSTSVSLGWAYKNTACRYEVISVKKIGCCD